MMSAPPRLIGSKRSFRLWGVPLLLFLSMEATATDPSSDPRLSFGPESTLSSGADGILGIPLSSSSGSSVSSGVLSSPDALMGAARSCYAGSECQAASQYRTLRQNRLRGYVNRSAAGFQWSPDSSSGQQSGQSAGPSGVLGGEEIRPYTGSQTIQQSSLIPLPPGVQ